MIADSLDHAARYAALHPAFGRAFEWLAGFDPSTADGNYPIGDGSEARVMSYRTSPAADRRWESHRRYIDIQLVVSGSERIDVADIALLSGATAYDEPADVVFYEGAPDGASAVLLRAREFAIFFPHDGHRPGIAHGEPRDVRKVVVKVPAQ